MLQPFVDGIDASFSRDDDDDDEDPSASSSRNGDDAVAETY